MCGCCMGEEGNWDALAISVCCVRGTPGTHASSVPGHPALAMRWPPAHTDKLKPECLGTRPLALCRAPARSWKRATSASPLPQTPPQSGVLVGGWVGCGVVACCDARQGMAWLPPATLCVRHTALPLPHRWSCPQARACAAAGAGPPDTAAAGGRSQLLLLA